MNNKYVTLKTFYITMLFLCCFIILCILTTVHFLNIREKELINSLTMPVQSIQSNEAKQDVQSQKEDYIADDNSISDVIYVVAEYDGRIGIFNASCTTVYEILDVYVDYLPDADKQYLKHGIKVYSNDELLSVIADYTG